MNKIIECDVLVLGSGASGLATAVTASHQGLKVVVLEKSDKFGGTTARSGGWLWIPCTKEAKAWGHNDTPETVKTYLKHEGGDAYNEERVDSFLKHSSDAYDFFTQKTAVKFDMPLVFPDYHAEAPGGAQGGRSMVTRPFDAKELKSELKHLEPPLPELTIFGMMMGSGAEIRHFMRATRSFESFIYTVKRFGKHFLEVLRYGRGMVLTNGNALAGRLMKSAMDQNITVMRNTAGKELIVENGAVTGVIAQSESNSITIKAKKGVVLAAGGFPHNLELRKKYYPHAVTGKQHWSPMKETNTGDSVQLVKPLNVIQDTHLPHPAAWCPISILPRKDGSTGIMPHFIDRAKPGVIAVNKEGQRFVNEANSYHDFMQGMMKSANIGGDLTCWLICDHKTLRLYGMGSVPPQPLPIQKYLKSGYLKKGATLEELANKCGISSNGLKKSVQRYNEFTETGKDQEFGKGSKAYNRYQGDALLAPNPCLASVSEGPFYAIQIRPGDIGTYAGLPVDKHSRVLNSSGQPVKGLFSVGNDATSIMGGNYPGAGITLGPALVFGYQTGLFLAKNKDNNLDLDTDVNKEVA